MKTPGLSRFIVPTQSKPLLPFLALQYSHLPFDFREMFLIHCKRGLRIDDVKWIALQLTKMKISFPEVSTLKYRKSLNVSIYFTVWREACTKSKVSWLTTQHNDAGQFKNQDSLFLTDHGASHQVSFKPGLAGSICIVWWLESGGTVLRIVFDGLCGPNLEKCILFQTHSHIPFLDWVKKRYPHFRLAKLVHGSNI